MNLLDDVITYVRRIVKSPSNALLSDELIIDYINRFYIMDVDARIQLFDLKTKYQFETQPGVTDYNMPLYTIQTEQGGNQIYPYPMYQGFSMPCYVNGIQVVFYTQRADFYNVWPYYLQSLNPSVVADGTPGPYVFNLPFFPAIPGHISLYGIMTAGTLPFPPPQPVAINPFIDPPVLQTFNPNYPVTSLNPGVYITATGTDNNTYTVTDSGQFLNTDVQVGFLQYAQQSTLPATVTQAGTVNYATGAVSVTFPVPIAAGTNIQSQCYFFEQGIPRAALFYNNTLTLRPPPDIPYLIEVDAYLTPAAFLSSASAVQFAYMAEYIARGAARKILTDTGDLEQFNFYEPLFKEQEILVWKRSQRQFTSTRTGTIFSEFGGPQNPSMYGQAQS